MARSVFSQEQAQLEDPGEVEQEEINEEGRVVEDPEQQQFVND